MQERLLQQLASPLKPTLKATNGFRRPPRPVYTHPIMGRLRRGHPNQSRRGWTTNASPVGVPAVPQGRHARPGTSHALNVTSTTDSVAKCALGEPRRYIWLTWSTRTPPRRSWVNICSPRPSWEAISTRSCSQIQFHLHVPF